jgi:hypothetical protein
MGRDAQLCVSLCCNIKGCSLLIASAQLRPRFIRDAQLRVSTILPFPEKRRLDIQAA